jgi:hypothetical protein
MRRVYQRFKRWRSARTARLPIPERLWAAAVELAREHGVSPTAQALHLEYGKLRRLMESASPVVKSRAVKAPAAGRRRARAIVPPAFVELMPSPTAGLSECMIELQGRRGKTRIHWKGTTAPDLGGLSRALWESK